MTTQQQEEIRAVIVVPTIREGSIRDFLSSWREELNSARILVIEDNPQRSFSLGEYPNVEHYAWEDIDRDLGANSWIIPRRTDSIRSYGFIKAFEEGPDIIITLDDDCYPSGECSNFIKQHWTRIQAGGQHQAWCPTGDGTITRGVPYFEYNRRWPCALNHGLWDAIPDYDAPTQLVESRQNRTFMPLEQTIPTGLYFPMCGMNIAFRPEVAPALYFLLMGPDWGYDRFGDIWAGVMVKKICDHLGYSINSGMPRVEHRRASNVWDNLRKEAPGLRTNEEFWREVDRIVLHGSDFGECYAEIANRLKPTSEYWSKLKEAMLTWTNLFRDRTNTVKTKV